jgi:hypothetical protein
MNYFYRFLFFLDPRIRQLNADNRALAQSLKVKLVPANHPIEERDRLFSIDFNRVGHQFSPRFEPPAPSKTPVSFDLRSYRIYPDNYLN